MLLEKDGGIKHAVETLKHTPCSLVHGDPSTLTFLHRRDKGQRKKKKKNKEKTMTNCNKRENMTQSLQCLVRLLFLTLIDKVLEENHSCLSPLFSFVKLLSFSFLYYIFFLILSLQFFLHFTTILIFYIYIFFVCLL